MTTQQKNRATLVLGISVMILGLLTVVQGVQARQYDKNQRTCLADNFGKLTEALTTRGDLTTRDQNNRNRSDASQTLLIVQVFQAKTPADAKKIFATFQATQAKVQAETAAIAKARKENPYPPFPPGTCDGVGGDLPEPE